MKDIIISERIVRRELKVLACCFVAAVLVNIVAIVMYDRPWTEVFSMIGYEVVISIVLYLAFTLIRVVVFLCRIAFSRLRK